MAHPLRVLVTGGGGLLGSQLCRAAPDQVVTTAAVGARPAPANVRSRRVELSDPEAFARLVADVSPDVVVHTAYRIEDGRRNIVGASESVAGVCAATGASLVHLSTDAVFDGEHAPYAEHDVARPVHDYGRDKADAEEVVRRLVPDAAIVRTSLIVAFDPPDLITARFVERLRAGRRVTLYDDEWRMPILVGDLAALIWELVLIERPQRAGVWHLPGAEALTRVDLGERLAAHYDLDESLIDRAPARSHPAARPRDLRLVADRALTLRHRPAEVR